MASQDSITRACNMVFVPLNKLQKISQQGYCVPLIRQSAHSNTPSLTPKENQCLELLVQGHNVKNIANEMRVSERRAQTLLQALRDKFKVNTDHWVVSKYYQLGMDYYSFGE